MSLMASELRGRCECKWNSEHPLILMACILRRKHFCIKSNEIKKRVAMQLNLWHQGKCEGLIQDITNTPLPTPDTALWPMTRRWPPENTTRQSLIDAYAPPSVGSPHAMEAASLAPTMPAPKQGTESVTYWRKNIRPCKSPTYQTPTTSHMPTKVKHRE